MSTPRYAKEGTPRYIKEAVLKYLESSDGTLLVQMFDHGINLNEYPESRNVIVNLLLGKPNRKQGRQPLSREEKAKNYSILMLLAELKGAGLKIISSGESTTETRSACEILAKIYGISESKIYKDIWGPNKNKPHVIQQMKLGKSNKEGLLSIYN